jgi:hypothetical protein
VAPLAAHRDAELDVEIRVVRRQRDGSPELALGGAEQPLRLQGQAQIGVQVRVVRLEADRALIGARLLGPLGLATVDRGEAHVGVEKVRLQPQGVLQRGLRVREAPLPLEHTPEARPPEAAGGREPRST